MESKIEHIGYLTDSIEETVQVFAKLGYNSGDITADDTQRARICFVFKDSETPIELVQPYEDNRTMQKMLTKCGSGPYHLCYSVEDIQDAFDELVTDNWIPLFKPVEAPALGNRLICYFYKQGIGYIELVNNE